MDSQGVFAAESVSSAAALPASWYCLHSKPKQEERAGANLFDQGLDFLLPLVREHRSGRGRVEPLFRGYLFVGINPGYGRLARVRSTRGVHSIVSFCGAPVLVPLAAIEELRSRMDASGIVTVPGAPAKRCDLRPGQQVRITLGLFSGLTGVFQRQLQAEDRVQVLLRTLTGYPIEEILPPSGVEPL